MPTSYRLAPPIAARFLGLGLVLIGLVVCLLTVAVAVFRMPLGWLAAVALIGLAAVVGAGWWLTRRAVVVRLTEEGYRVRLVRGVGVAQGRWVDVDDAVATTVGSSPCLVLRRRDGGSTAIPLDVLAGSTEAFVDDVKERLQHGHGLRRLG